MGFETNSIIIDSGATGSTAVFTESLSAATISGTNVYATSLFQNGVIVDINNKADLSGATFTGTVKAPLLSATTYGTTATTGSIFFSNNNIINNNTNRLSWDNNNFGLLITSSGVTTGSTYQLQSPVYVRLNDDNFHHYNIQNLSTGSSAASEYVVTADNGDRDNKFFALGINNSQFNDINYYLMGPNSGYLLINGGDLVVGTQTAHDIVFHTSGVTMGKETMRIRKSGNVMINTTSGSTDMGYELQISGNTWVSSGLSASTITATNFISGSTNITQVFLPKTSFSGVTKITVSTSKPIEPSIGDLWVDTN